VRWVGLLVINLAAVSACWGCWRHAHAQPVFDAAPIVIVYPCPADAGKDRLP
jgi:cytochrome b